MRKMKVSLLPLPLFPLHTSHPLLPLLFLPLQPPNDPLGRNRIPSPVSHI
jgi:hypothetical protein